METTDKNIDNDAVELLSLLLYHSFSIEELRNVASVCFIVCNKVMDKKTLVTKIIETKRWSLILNMLDINDFRICTKCGSLMFQGYCYDMGNGYYCSETCLNQDFTIEDWLQECETNDQSYWTDWYEHYELTATPNNFFL